MKKILVIMVSMLCILLSLSGSAMAGSGESEPHVKLGIAIYDFIVGNDFKTIESMDGVKELLTDIKELGYEGIEWFNLKLGAKYMDVQELRTIMDELGLESTSLIFTFKRFEGLEEDMAEAVERCKILGIDKIVLTYSHPTQFDIEPDENGDFTPEQIDEWLENLNKVTGIMMQEAQGTGIKILYHSHQQDFFQCSDGSYVIDKANLDGKEIDILWATRGIDTTLASTVAYLKENADSIYLMHVKDAIDGSTEEKEMFAWGQGNYDLQSIIDVARENDHIEWIIAENDYPVGSGLEDAAITAEYARTSLDFSK